MTTYQHTIEPFRVLEADDVSRYSVHVTVGRNYNSSCPPLWTGRQDDGSFVTRATRPMPDTEWSALKSRIRDLLRTDRGCYHEGDGRGWSESWGNEQSFTCVVPLAGLNLDALRAQLAAVCRQWHQDAVTLVVAAPEFIGPEGGIP